MMTAISKYQFTLDLAVRDYECDLAGMVNNAVYLNYLEHARHVFLKEQGIDFKAWVEKGIALVVIRVEIDYLWALRSGDQFRVGINTERVSRLRFGFLQEISRLPDLKPVCRAKVVGTAINNSSNRPVWLPEIAALIGDEK